MSKNPVNMAASVRDRLKSIRNRTGQEYNTLLTRYTIERFLYRLSVSEHRSRFVLKGALLFVLWHESAHRITRDLDLLGFGGPSPDELTRILREVCSVPAPDDGVVFDLESVTAEPIRAQELYVGIRLAVRASIGNAVNVMQVDVGFGDATASEPVEVEFPRLLEDMPAAKIRAYRMETTVAEKFDAMLAHGLLNSRMKDYYDIWFLSRHFSFGGASLAESIQKTCERRGHALKAAVPGGLSQVFWNDPSRQALWLSFWRKSVRLEPVIPFPEVAAFAASFLMPPMMAAAQDRPFSASWKPGGPWRDDA
ncbi:MAG: nucleotidyl transferase AbiEii/AbiGii toxin family protein [Verrucomicrobiaceae bacterium]|nr:MAG: nucleotidyl transferase AbiEii/AbiGii toxin family protein [Verrucomicrobiaceae bacterium]